ncbi:MAG: hypothetical protein CL802_15810 [Citromicrobium sp.]|nr:hypothetical protein [Citromicrobium sp.]|tara:strand:+ start:4067 stop:6094 length:2028 start_codon:yes stop_codon:yes gene_type:complete
MLIRRDNAKAALLSMLLCFAPAISAAVAQPGEGGGSEEEGNADGFAPPPEKFSISPGGVDMRSGAYVYENIDLVIGNGEGSLELKRILPTGIFNHIEPFGNFSHNWDVFLNEESIDIAGGDFEPGSGTDLRVKIRFGGRSDTFQRLSQNTGFDQVSYEITGRLTYSGTTNTVYTFTAGDGTVVTFRPLGTECGGVGGCAFASSILQPDGTLYELAYDEPTTDPNDTRLRRVTSNRGYALLLEYGSSGLVDHVTKACVLNLAEQALPTGYDCPTSNVSEVTYQYAWFDGPSAFDPAHYRLSSFTDQTSRTSSISYETTGNEVLTKFFDPGSSSPRLINKSSMQLTSEAEVELVSSQTLITGETYDYFWYQKPPSGALNPGITEYIGGIVTDADDNTVIYEFGFFPMPKSFSPERVTGMGAYPYVNFGEIAWQVTPGPIRVVDQLGRETLHDYCDPYAAANLPQQETNRCLVTMKQSTTLPEGQRLEFEYDGWGTKNLTLIKTVVDPSDPGSAFIEQEATYSSCANLIVCSQPLTQTDANGHVTEFEYSTVHGGIIRKTLPADGNGVRPSVHYSYGQRTARDLNGTAFSAVWVLLSEATCISSAMSVSNDVPSCAGGSADMVTTAYDYGPLTGPNNLWVRGVAVSANGQTLRTCFEYDDLGRKISETLPAANLTSCS